MNSSTITASAAAQEPASLPARKPLPKWIQKIDSTEKASFIINAWLALDPHTQDAFLAQLIAATVHEGPDTALGQFASTGRLSPEAALAELNDVHVPIEREPWLDALGRYILASAGGRS